MQVMRVRGACVLPYAYALKEHKETSLALYILTIDGHKERPK